MPLYFVIWHHAYHYGFGKSTRGSSNTLPETNSSHLPVSAMPKGNEKVFQSSICRCELLVSGRVFLLIDTYTKEIKRSPKMFQTKEIHAIKQKPLAA